MRYDRRIEHQGGFKQAPNPVIPFAISLDDPDEKPSDRLLISLWRVPTISRRKVDKHSPKILWYTDEGNSYQMQSTQHGSFACDGEEEFAAFRLDHAAVVQAGAAFEAVLARDGFYEAACEDGRYTRGVPRRPGPGDA